MILSFIGKSKGLTGCLVWCLLLPWSSLGFGDEKGGWDSFQESRVFAKNSIGLALSRNFPVQKSTEQFVPGQPHLMVTYRYFDHPWVLGVFSQFKMFMDAESQEPYALWTLGEELMYGVRLHHPVYVYAGAKILYLAPVQNARLPPRRRQGDDVEVGIAAAVSVYYFVDETKAWTLSFDRWRGTKTTKYQGMDVSFGLNWALF